MRNVIIPLNAYDNVEVTTNGQESFVKLIADSGAYGIEIRRELLPAENGQIEKIKSEIDQYDLFTVYSAPIECWKEDGQLNKEQLSEIFQEAVFLGAKWVKVSLGHFKKNQSNFVELKKMLSQHQDKQLLIENDQTPYGGNVKHLLAFFESVTEYEVPVKMTFDAGNWFYTGQDVEEALESLAPHVIYIHLKQVTDELETVPLQPEGEHSWKKVMGHFPADIVKALEFPIRPKVKTKDYIQMIMDLEKEREGAITCSR
ncbi:sugar phosphate isomerase/epimerase family protein [Bacillus sp. USDA818B3_A]|uniref:sugar phosphate isomerase/epimerase family protein n=1 Tax=Bacillus sp. USDA818B3_A TaxID=2698834 RepID=UPI00136BC332|nr:TIM barrel protein [Bacillus sp. USDA818B3_A]